MNAASYNPTSGVLEGLIASGELSIIRNQELRGLLASWPGRVSENAEDEEWVFRDVQSIYSPYLNSVIPTRNIWIQTPSLDAKLPRSPSHPDYSVLFGQTDFENLVSMRAAGAAILIRENTDLREAVEQILELARLELR